MTEADLPLLRAECGQLLSQISETMGEHTGILQGVERQMAATNGSFQRHVVEAAQRFSDIEAGQIRREGRDDALEAFALAAEERMKRLERERTRWAGAFRLAAWLAGGVVTLMTLGTAIMALVMFL